MVAAVGSVLWLRAPDPSPSSEPAQWTNGSVDDYWHIVDRVYSSVGFTYHPTTCERLEAIAPDGLALRLPLTAPSTDLYWEATPRGLARSSMPVGIGRCKLR